MIVAWGIAPTISGTRYTLSTLRLRFAFNDTIPPGIVLSNQVFVEGDSWRRIVWISLVAGGKCFVHPPALPSATTRSTSTGHWGMRSRSMAQGTSQSTRPIPLTALELLQGTTWLGSQKWVGKFLVGSQLGSTTFVALQPTWAVRIARRLADHGRRLTSMRPSTHWSIPADRSTSLWLLTEAQRQARRDGSHRVWRLPRDSRTRVLARQVAPWSGMILSSVLLSTYFASSRYQPPFYPGFVFLPCTADRGR